MKPPAAKPASKTRSSPPPRTVVVTHQPQWRLLAGLASVGIVAVMITHWPALSANAISFDDDQYLVKNQLVQNPSWAAAGRFMSEVLKPSTVEGYYQPLAMISLMLDTAMGGSPKYLRPYHRTSLALHLANTALIIVLLHLLFRQPWAAAAAGLLYGVHPLTVEPIPWVGERKTLLATFFALWCFIAYVRYTERRSKGLYFAAIGMYTLALLAKPTTTPVAVLLLVLDYWPLKRLNKMAIIEKVPFIVIAGVSSLITIWSQRQTAGAVLPTEFASPMRVPFILCHNIVFYLWKTLCPVNLTSHYPFPKPLTLENSAVLIGVLGTVLLLSVLLISLRWTRALVTGWLFFFLAIFPTMGVIGFTNVIASDKYAYLPLVGFLLPLAFYLNMFLQKAGDSGRLRKRRMVMMISVLLIASVEAIATRHYLSYWRDTDTLYGRMMELAPTSAVVRYNRANALAEEGRVSEAMKLYRETLSIDPDYAPAHTNLAMYLVEQGQEQEAMQHYEKALANKPDSAETHNNIAIPLLKAGRLDEAIQHCRKALEYKQNFPEAHHNLAATLSKKGEIPEAIHHYQEALRLKPNYPNAEFNFANLLLEQGREQEAVEHFLKAVHQKPDYAEAHNELGVIYARRGRLTEAEQHYQQAVRAKPAWLDAHYNLAMALAAQNKNDEAIAAYRELLHIAPREADAHAALGDLLSRKGQIDEAIREFQEALRINPAHAAATQRLQQLRETK